MLFVLSNHHHYHSTLPIVLPHHPKAPQIIVLLIEKEREVGVVGVDIPPPVKTTTMQGEVILAGIIFPLLENAVHPVI